MIEASFKIIFVRVFFDIILYDVNGADGKSSDWDQPGPGAGAPGDTPELESTTVTGDTATDSGDQDRLSICHRSSDTGDVMV